MNNYLVMFDHKFFDVVVMVVMEWLWYLKPETLGMTDLI